MHGNKFSCLLNGWPVWFIRNIKCAMPDISEMFTTQSAQMVNDPNRLDPHGMHTFTPTLFRLWKYWHQFCDFLIKFNGFIELRHLSVLFFFCSLFRFLPSFTQNNDYYWTELIVHRTHSSCTAVVMDFQFGINKLHSLQYDKNICVGTSAQRHTCSNTEIKISTIYNLFFCFLF